MRRLRFELLAMALAVLLAGISVVATFGSARTGDLVFCRIVDQEGIVVGITTDCSVTAAADEDPPTTFDGASATVSSSPSPGPVVDAPITLTVRLDRPPGD